MIEADKTKEMLRRVRQVEILSRKAVTESLVGAYHSVFRGQGIDFEEVREYTPGDDVRTIDWNVTARMDRPFIKVFREERELTMMLVIDVSPSGMFGSTKGTKRELAAEIACTLAFSATRNNDKVGLILFSDHIEKFVSPRKGRRHILRIIREILYHKPAGRRTDLALAVKRAGESLSRHAIIFVLSDFTPTDNVPQQMEALSKQLAVNGKRHDLVGIELTDPRERNIPAMGLLTLEDAETGQTVEVNSSSSLVRKNIAKSFDDHRLLVKQTFRKAGVDLINLTTSEPYMNALYGYFRQRERLS